MLDPQFSMDLDQFCRWLGKHASGLAEAFWQAAPAGVSPMPSHFRAFRDSELRAFLDSELPDERRGEFVMQLALLVLLDAADRKRAWVQGIPKFVCFDDRWRYNNPFQLWYESDALRLPHGTDMEASLRACFARLNSSDSMVHEDRFDAVLERIGRDRSWKSFCRHHNAESSRGALRMQLWRLLSEREDARRKRMRDEAEREAAEQKRQAAEEKQRGFVAELEMLRSRHRALRRNRLGGVRSSRPGRLSDWLRPCSQEGEAALAQLDRKRVAKRALWYPSSGEDVRDLLEFGSSIGERHRFPERPAIYIHTDPRHCDQGCKPVFVRAEAEDRHIFCGHSESELEVEISQEHRLQVAAPDRLFPERPDYVCATQQAICQATPALLREVSILVGRQKVVTEWILHVPMSNLEFLANIIMPKFVTPGSIAKIRAGTGFGLCNYCPSCFYQYLYSVGCRQAILDHEVRPPADPIDRELCLRWASLGNPLPTAFQLEPRGAPFEWSCLAARAYMIAPVGHAKASAHDFMERVLQVAGEIRPPAS